MDERRHPRGDRPRRGRRSPPGHGSSPQLLTEPAGRLFFVAADEEHGQELWETDGTAAGTTLAADLAPGPGGFSFSHLVSAGAHLFFSGGPSDLSRQGLWVSDGTAAGTRLLVDVLIQPDVRPIQAPGVLGDRLFFASIGDQVLWTSDGTEEGTQPLSTASGMQICEPESYQVFAGRLIFSAEGGLYESDGTGEGTAKILDLAAPADASFFEVVPAGPVCSSASGTGSRARSSGLWRPNDNCHPKLLTSLPGVPPAGPPDCLWKRRDP